MNRLLTACFCSIVFTRTDQPNSIPFDCPFSRFCYMRHSTHLRLVLPFSPTLPFIQDRSYLGCSLLLSCADLLILALMLTDSSYYSSTYCYSIKMPSFAKPTIPDSSNPLVGLWKDHSNAAPLEVSPRLSPLLFPEANIQDLITYHRTRAAEILSNIIPSKITHLRQLISSETDPSSVLWSGHVDADDNDFKLPRMIQPDHVHKLLIQPTAGVERVGRLDKGDLNKGEKVVLPSEVTRAESSLEKGEGQEDDEYVVQKSKMNGNGHGENGVGGADVVEKGVRVGPHWFEVVPRNKIQTECVSMTTAWVFSSIYRE